MKQIKDLQMKLQNFMQLVDIVEINYMIEKIENWIASLFCDHNWVYKNDCRGICTHTEQVCTKCGKTRIVKL